LPITLFFSYIANVIVFIIELRVERSGGITPNYSRYVNKQYTFTN